MTHKLKSIHFVFEISSKKEYEKCKEIFDKISSEKFEMETVWIREDK